jgi:rSAM/selenodomain-associated transferase 2/rSAM/selenodomain-associated transferase 1
MDAETKSPPKDTLIIFSRYPQPGTAKTRLIPVLGAEGAAVLQRRMTEHALATASALNRRHPLAIEIHFEDGGPERMRRWLGAAATFRRQKTGDIGQRMRHALADAFAGQADRAVLIGTDIPGITSDLLEKAYRLLADNDLVFGPAADGGYYLIGATAAAFQKLEGRLFDGIEWGGSRVLEQSLARAGEAGATVERVETLTDVDRPTDLPAWIGRSRSNPPALAKPLISVIIPSLNEAGHIGRTLASVAGKPGIEILVVDGGSSDETARIASDQGARVYRTPATKAGQMNAGAALARGEVLLFLHADTRPPQNFGAHVRETLARPGVAAGAFRLGIDAAGGRLRFIETVANVRSRFLGMPYGDQALFMTAEMFGAVGGYPEQPIMEDFELVRRLRRRGGIAIAPAAVATSPRRWLNVGVMRTWLINQSIVTAYLAGVSPDRLAGWYRREKGRPDPAVRTGQGK